MTFSRSAAAQIFGAIIAAALVAFVPHQAAAQSATATTKPAAKSAAKPAAKPAATQTGSSDYWSVNTSLPSQYSTERTRQQQPRTASTQRNASQGVQTETTSEFGRLPVQGAAGSTVGFTSGQSASSGRFSDGRTVPGIDPNTRSESSFVGLSLTTSSASKGFIVPVPTPWGPPQ